MRKSAAGEAEYNDQLASRYFDIWETYPIQRFTHQVESQWIQELVQPGQRVLLAGSGGGRAIKALLRSAGEIVALDISKEMLRIGRERFPEDKISWRLGDVHEPPDDLTGFDHIFALGGVLAYLEDPKKAVMSLANRLNTNGRLTACVMNSEHPTETPGKKELENGRVRIPYNLQEVCDVMQDAGLTPDTVRGFRFLVDLLPTDWNKGAVEDQEIRKIMDKAIELESKLLHLMPSEKGKFIWVEGLRI